MQVQRFKEDHNHAIFASVNICHVACYTLIVETFARQTFANFVDFGLFRKSLSREIFENSDSRKLVSQIFFDFLNWESLSSQNFLLSSKIFWPLLLSTEIFKQPLFSADSLLFLCFSLQSKSRDFGLRYLNAVLEIPTSSFLLI